jgi:hypothetical protein
MHSRDNSKSNQTNEFSCSDSRFVTAVGDRGARPRLNSQFGRGQQPSGISWSDVERITQGRLGRTVRAPCPFCSHLRQHANQRKPVFGVKLKEPDFAIYNCAHCGEHGYVHPDLLRAIIDPAERQRRQAEAARRELEDKQQRTASALKLWNERQSFIGSPAATYLRLTRGIGDWLDAFDLDQSLGFHPSCPFGNERLPCMVALVRNIETDEPQAIHRTALTTGPRPERIERLSFVLMSMWLSQSEVPSLL